MDEVNQQVMGFARAAMKTKTRDVSIALVAARELRIGLHESQVIHPSGSTMFHARCAVPAPAVWSDAAIDAFTCYCDIL